MIHQPFHSIEQLLDCMGSLVDPSGGLRQIATLVADLRPALVLLLCQKRGLLALERLDETLERGDWEHCARHLTERIADTRCDLCETTVGNRKRTALTIRIAQEGEWCALGLLLDANRDECSRLLHIVDPLRICAELAVRVLDGHEERRRLITENKHLRAEFCTLRASHGEAVIEAVQQREQRLAGDAKREALEQFLQAAQRANESKSAFLATMSHEIRTPMTAILGYGELLAERIEDPENLEIVGTIMRNGEYLLGILNDILDISKIEAGRLEVQRVPSSVHQVVAEVIGLMQVRAQAKGLQLTATSEGTIPDTILTDPLRLRQILTNLVGNALKFTERGEVWLRLRLCGLPSKPCLELQVLDTGIGMSQEQLTHLFQPFSQVDAEVSRRYSGTGLGLVISKRLAEMLGGDIAVQSILGKGSAFTLTIDPGAVDGVSRSPYRDAAAAKEASPRTGRASQIPPGCRVLLAEDNPDNQRLIQTILSKAGIQVTLANNGQEAVDKVLAAIEAADRDRLPRQRAFDVILMDFDMPVLNGLDATRRLRQEGYRAPIVALTAHTMHQEIDRCLEAGCDLHLSKPIDREKLLDVIASMTNLSERSEQAARAESSPPRFPFPFADSPERPSR
jgi:signal transduction histidine kinase/CheY-like chemotaxis protein